MIPALWQQTACPEASWQPHHMITVRSESYVLGVQRIRHESNTNLVRTGWARLILVRALRATSVTSRAAGWHRRLECRASFSYLIFLGFRARSDARRRPPMRLNR